MMNSWKPALNTYRYLTRNKVQVIMNYNLNDLQAKAPKTSTWSSFGKLLQLISHERKNLWLAFFTILITSTINLLGPLVIGNTIDDYIVTAHKNYHGVLVNCGILFCMYLVSLVSSYVQTMLMGGIGQRMLF